MMNEKEQHQLHFPEILAPAGTADAMRAAVNAGCDAVYLGGDLFGARAFAGNFGREEMVKTLDYCHLFGVKVYMTVNTLLKPGEIGTLADYMRPFYEAGLDGVIVQDAGVVRVLKNAFPDLPLHASTQMSISSAYGAQFLKDQGFTRVVPARELSLRELIAIREKVDIEIETFVHGAMCYAYSGKCLFSGYFGGRSGNRGRCAQPCRQWYETSDKASGYLMSMKDMCTLELLPRLMDAGLDSLKIEGRMKNPYYVAATVDAYRKARELYLQLQMNCRRQSEEAKAVIWEELPKALKDQYLLKAAELTDEMRDIYNRGGFCTGYYETDKGPVMIADKRPNHTGLKIGSVESIKGPDVTIRLTKPVNSRDILEILPAQVEITANQQGKKGGSICLKGKELKKLKPGMEVYRTRNHTLLDKIEKELLLPEKKISAEAVITARTNEPLMITLRRGEACVQVQGNPVQTASSKPTDAASLADKMGKTGGSHVLLRVSCEMDEQVFVPMSEFNELRRQAVDRLKQAIAARYHRIGK